MNQKVLHVDVEKGVFKSYPLPLDIRRDFLGGRGINGLILSGNLPEDPDPLIPEAPLIIGAGILTGTSSPSASRCSITARSPETGYLGDSNFGGHFGAHLRRTGFDHLIIRGRAEKPVCLLLTSEEHLLIDAVDLWGLDCIQTMQALQDRHGSGAQVLCIGPAGEQLVRFACVRHDLKSTAGRGGLGCLMGHKRLKAIVVMGDIRSEVFQREELKKLSRRLHKRLIASRTREVLHKYGTPCLFDLHNYAGVVRTRNGIDSHFSDGRSIRSKKFQPYYIKSRACFGCNIACRHEYSFISSAGKKIHGVGPEYGVVGAFGPICGISDPESILIINDRINRLGLDASSTGNIIAWAMELFEAGTVTHKDTKGLELTWGNSKVVLQLIEDMATRHGFGDILARGAFEASRLLGTKTRKSLMWSKNLLQSDSVDLRAYKGFALGVATSSRGADHLRGRPTLEALHLPPETLQNIYDGPVSPDPASYQGKALMVHRSEIEYALGDALGICRFAQRFNSLDHLGVSELAELVELATGLGLNESDLWKTGQRIITLERHILGRMGLSRAHDSLPERYFQPVNNGPRRGDCIDPDMFQQMLDEYYALHGWNNETGYPEPETLERLGITAAQNFLTLK